MREANPTPESIPRPRYVTGCCCPHLMMALTCWLRNRREAPALDTLPAMMPLPSFTRHGAAYSPERGSQSTSQSGRSAVKPHRPSTTAIVVANEDDKPIRKSESIRRPHKEQADGTPRSKRAAPIRKSSAPTPPPRSRRASGSASASRPRTTNGEPRGVPSRPAPKVPPPVATRPPRVQKDARTVHQPPSYPAPSMPLGQRNVSDDKAQARTGKLLQSEKNSPSKPSPLRKQLSSTRSTLPQGVHSTCYSTHVACIASLGLMDSVYALRLDSFV
jgi:hypothetical protein